MNKKRANWSVVVCIFLFSAVVAAQEQTGQQTQPQNTPCRTLVNYQGSDSQGNPYSGAAGELVKEADVLRESKQYAEAVKKYTQAIKLISDESICVSDNVWLNSGDCRIEIGNYQGAVADYDQFFKQYDPMVLMANRKTGPTDVADYVQFYKMVDDLPQTDRFLKDTYNKLKPRLSLAFYKRGLAKDKLNDEVSARNDLRQSCNLGNKDACGRYDAMLNSTVSKGQNRSDSSELVETEWKTAPIQVPWTDGITIIYIYRFAEGGKVGRLILINQPPGEKFNPFTKRLDPTMGIFNNVLSDTGTYIQTGSSVHMEFTYENQDAAIQGDKMAGYNRSKTGSGNDSELAFVAQKLSTETNPWRELTASTLIGTWEGSVNQTPCTLVIDKSEGHTFSGEIRIGGGRAAFTGKIEDSTTHRISFGVNLGFVDNIGKAMRGAGSNGGNIYVWDFSKKDTLR